MPLSRTVRGALTAATAAAALAAGAAPALGQDLSRPAYGYDFNGTLDPSAGTSPLVPLGTGHAYTATPVINGAQQYLTVPAGSGVALQLGTPSSDTIGTLSAYVRLDDVAGRKRLIDLSDGTSDDGFYVDAGRLVLVEGGVAVAGQAGTLGAAQLFAAGEFNHVVVHYDGAEVQAFVNGVQVFAHTESTLGATFSDTVRLFTDEGAEESAAAIGRLRYWPTYDLTDAELALVNGSALDTVAPTVWHEPGKAVKGRPFLFGSADDESTANLDLTVEVRRGAAVVASGAPVRFSEEWEWEYPAEEASLANGVTYVLRVSATDGAGNTTTVDRTVTADKFAPTGLTVDQPGSSTTERNPFVGGAARREGNNWAFVSVAVYKGTTADHDNPADWVGTPDGAITNGRWGGRLEKWKMDGSRVPVSLPNGTYVVDGEHCDAAYNCTPVKKTFRVTTPRVPRPPKPPREQRPAQPFVPAPVGGPRLLAAQLLDAALSRLAGEGIRGLLKDGSGIKLQASEPGTAIVQVYAGPKAPKAVAAAKKPAKTKAKAKKAKGKLLAQGRRVFKASGTGIVQVKATAAGRKALRGKRKAVVTVRTIFVPRGGKPVAVDRKLTLKR